MYLTITDCYVLRRNSGSLEEGKVAPASRCNHDPPEAPSLVFFLSVPGLVLQSHADFQHGQAQAQATTVQPVCGSEAKRTGAAEDGCHAQCLVDQCSGLAQYFFLKKGLAQYFEKAEDAGMLI